MKKLTLLALMILALLMTACTGAQISSAEKTQMRTKSYDADYDTTFRATMSVLENQGYTIDNTDMASGLIRANIAKEAYSKANKIASAIFLGVGKSGSKIYDLSTTVTKASATSTRVRLNINLKEQRKVGWNSDEKYEEVNDQEVYNVLHNEIQLEIARMQAANK